MVNGIYAILLKYKIKKYHTSDENNLQFRYSLHKSIQK